MRPAEERTQFGHVPCGRDAESNRIGEPPDRLSPVASGRMDIREPQRAVWVHLHHPARGGRQRREWLRPDALVGLAQSEDGEL